jgi:hypothetical protein
MISNYYTSQLPQFSGGPQIANFSNAGITLSSDTSTDRRGLMFHKLSPFPIDLQAFAYVIMPNTSFIGSGFELYVMNVISYGTISAALETNTVGAKYLAVRVNNFNNQGTLGTAVLCPFQAGLSYLLTLSIVDGAAVNSTAIRAELTTSRNTSVAVAYIQTGTVDSIGDLSAPIYATGVAQSKKITLAAAAEQTTASQTSSPVTAVAFSAGIRKKDGIVISTASTTPVTAAPVAGLSEDATIAIVLGSVLGGFCLCCTYFVLMLCLCFYRQRMRREKVEIQRSTVRAIRKESLPEIVITQHPHSTFQRVRSRTLDTKLLYQEPQPVAMIAPQEQSVPAPPIIEIPINPIIPPRTVVIPPTVQQRNQVITPLIIPQDNHPHVVKLETAILPHPEQKPKIVEPVKQPDIVIEMPEPPRIEIEYPSPLSTPAPQRVIQPPVPFQRQRTAPNHTFEQAAPLRRQRTSSQLQVTLPQHNTAQHQPETQKQSTNSRKRAVTWYHQPRGSILVPNPDQPHYEDVSTSDVSLQID